MRIDFRYSYQGDKIIIFIVFPSSEQANTKNRCLVGRLEFLKKEALKAHKVFLNVTSSQWKRTPEKLSPSGKRKI